MSGVLETMWLNLLACAIFELSFISLWNKVTGFQVHHLLLRFLSLFRQNSYCVSIYSAKGLIPVLFKLMERCSLISVGYGSGSKWLWYCNSGGWDEGDIITFPPFPLMVISNEQLGVSDWSPLFCPYQRASRSVQTLLVLIDQGKEDRGCNRTGTAKIVGVETYKNDIYHDIVLSLALSFSLPWKLKTYKSHKET